MIPHRGEQMFAFSRHFLYGWFIGHSITNKHTNRYLSCQIHHRLPLWHAEAAAVCLITSWEDEYGGSDGVAREPEAVLTHQGSTQLDHMQLKLGYVYFFPAHLLSHLEADIQGWTWTLGPGDDVVWTFFPFFFFDSNCARTHWDGGDMTIMATSRPSMRRRRSLHTTWYKS